MDSIWKNDSIRRTLILLAVLTTLVGCKPKVTAPPSKSSTSDEYVICTTFYPTTYFAKRIGGKISSLAIRCPLPGEQDPAHWIPDSQTITIFQQADVMIFNGAHFEKWKDKISLRDSRVILTADSFRNEWMNYQDVQLHAHGKGKHSHEGIDGHTWLDPLNAKRQAKTILDSIVKLQPEHAAELTKNFNALAADLDTLDDELKALGNITIACSHPAYNYLARRYRWAHVNLPLDPGQVPTDQALAEIGERLKASPGAEKILLWEDTPGKDVAAAMEEKFGLHSIVFSPCEQPPAGEKDFISVMRSNIAALRAALQRPKTNP